MSAIATKPHAYITVNATSVDPSFREALVIFIQRRIEQCLAIYHPEVTIAARESRFGQDTVHVYSLDADVELDEEYAAEIAEEIVYIADAAKRFACGQGWNEATILTIPGRQN